MKRPNDGAVAACSLNDSEFHERRALGRRTLLPQVTASKRIQDGLILTFVGDEFLRSDLETFVSLERQCCGFLEFTISSDIAGPDSPIELRIVGRPEAAATIEMFAQAVRGVP